MRKQVSISVKQAVLDVVLELTGGSTNVVFTIREVKEAFSKKYPQFSVRSVESRIIKDCVNHNSHEHHTHDENRYWRVGYAKYRLYTHVLNERNINQ